MPKPGPVTFSLPATWWSYSPFHNQIRNIFNIGFKDFIVPENCVFAIGDNREGSIDCRNFGCIPMEKIEGKVWIRITPFNKFGKV